MRFRTLPALAALALFGCAAAARAQEPQKDEKVIEDFVTTRGVSFDTPGGQKPSAPRRNTLAKGKAAGANAGVAARGKGPAGKGASPAKSNGDGAEAAAKGDGADSSGAQFSKAGGARRPLALGYTILLKDDAGGLFVADAAREFRTGERFAVALETNADGYLYLFSAENGRNPELLFPNAQIDGGANAVRAHARATIPTGPGADVEYFVDVTDPPATEHLFVIFSRRPLADVPAGEALVTYCGKNLEACAWRPTPAQWARIAGGAKGRGVTEAKNTQLAQAPQPVAPAALQRGLKVKREDPRPAVVRVNDSPEADVLITEIVLTHK
ncbi:MAG TPA: DUF4384 domain-containing protein [Pyrinomonadaceae bacterium]|jgi:hypothetical protein